ncbi:MAG: site-specific integrase [Candidatus Margulisbacteria bacterium]|jgi:integrase|nr:site-specific integrase [Candidatus Margulisiibacteriota bacterium]
MLFKKTLKSYAENLFNPNGKWRKNRESKGWNLVDKAIADKNALVRNHIIPLWGKRQPDKISIKEINEKLYTLDLSNATKNKILVCLNDIFTYLAEQEFIKRNPIVEISRFSDRPVLHRGALSPEEIDILFPQSHAELLKIWGSEMYACAFLVLKDTGMRPGELRALRWGDWYPEHRFIPVTKAIEASKRTKIKSTKTGTTKPAIISKFTAAELNNYRDKIKALPENFIFICKSGLPVSDSILSKRFRRGASRAGLNRPEVTPYWLRYTFNTRMLEVMPDETVRKLMGHATPAMTKRYRDADIASLKREAQKISPLYPESYTITPAPEDLQLAFGF